MLPLLRLERKQNNFSIPFRIRIFTLSFLLIWNWNDKYIHTLSSSLENHTRFHAKMGKVYTRFQTKATQKPYRMGRHIPLDDHSSMQFMYNFRNLSNKLPTIFWSVNFWHFTPQVMLFFLGKRNLKCSDSKVWLRSGSQKNSHVRKKINCI